MKLVIGSDHAGLPLKDFFKTHRTDIEWIDVGPFNTDSVDYPDYADLVVKKSLEEKCLGVLICGSGQGMAIRANKHLEIRAALCWDVEVAKLSRQHNDANILCLGARLIPFNKALEILDVFLKTPFEGGRHFTRVRKLSNKT